MTYADVHLNTDWKNQKSVVQPVFDNARACRCKQWIAVEDQEPPLHTPILVSDGKLMSIGRRYPGIFGTPRSWRMDGWNIQPTHWMSLPKQPET